MLEISKKAFININDHDRAQHQPEEAIVIHPSIPDGTYRPQDFIEVEVKYTVPSYLLRLRPREYNGKTYYHLINNEPEKILPYGLFMNTLKTIRNSVFTEEGAHLEWNLYPGQPIWEFALPVEELTKTIVGYHNRIVVEVLPDMK